MNTRRSREGFALMAALWLVVIIGVTGYELSVRSRTGRLAVANSLEEAAARAAADAGLETARSHLEESFGRPLAVTRTPLGGSAFDPWSAIDWRSADTVHLGDERLLVNAYDAGTRLQLNRASEGDLRRLMIALRVDAGMADRLAQRILDWRDADDSRRGRGAERADYLRAGLRVMPADADFGSVAELRDLDGMTPDVYVRLSPLLTLYGTGQVNVNAASPEVLRSLPGIGDEAVSAIVRAQRSSRSLRSIDELVALLSRGAASAISDAGMELTQRMAFETREMVVTTEGWRDGSPVHARGEALFVRSGDATFAVARRVFTP